jgi:hypothetical protein
MHEAARARTAIESMYKGLLLTTLEDKHIGGLKTHGDMGIWVSYACGCVDGEEQVHEGGQSIYGKRRRVDAL